jgi:hypothetical protein
LHVNFHVIPKLDQLYDHDDFDDFHVSRRRLPRRKRLSAMEALEFALSSREPELKAERGMV